MKKVLVFIVLIGSLGTVGGVLAHDCGCHHGHHRCGWHHSHHHCCGCQHQCPAAEKPAEIK